MSSHAIPYVTPEQYLEAERQALDKSEYLDGQIYAMAGAKPRHIRIGTNLVFRISSALEGGSCQVFDSDMRVHIPATGLYTYADVSVVCGEPVFVQGDNLVNPIVIVEVSSKSTEKYDRNAKFLYYQSISSLKEYVLVSQFSRRITHCKRTAADDWRIQNIDAGTGRLQLASIGVELTFDQIYTRVDSLPA
jgi:Uma2 family endonuclease